MLSEIEARVLGCLLEKERTVPDQYPLTLNALASACNQSQSRDPIMHLDDHEIESAISVLKGSGWVRLVHPSHGRSVTRFRHVADEKLTLEPDSAAVIALLLLRGPQTVAELRSRTERLHPFESLDEVERILRTLAERELVRLLDRLPGQKEPRWQQLLAEERESTVVTRPALAVPSAVVGSMADRIEQMEARIARLETALAELL
ncbi:MAG: YceH family protein [Actinomycetota bacterium]